MTPKQGEEFKCREREKEGKEREREVAYKTFRNQNDIKLELQSLKLKDNGVTFKILRENYFRVRI